MLLLQQLQEFHVSLSPLRKAEEDMSLLLLNSGKRGKKKFLLHLFVGLLDFPVSLDFSVVSKPTFLKLLGVPGAVSGCYAILKLVGLRQGLLKPRLTFNLMHS